jgi:hypothetical protein
MNSVSQQAFLYSIIMSLLLNFSPPPQFLSSSSIPLLLLLLLNLSLPPQFLSSSSITLPLNFSPPPQFISL